MYRMAYEVYSHVLNTLLLPDRSQIKSFACNKTNKDATKQATPYTFVDSLNLYSCTCFGHGWERSEKNTRNGSLRFGIFSTFWIKPAGIVILVLLLYYIVFILYCTVLSFFFSHLYSTLAWADDGRGLDNQYQRLQRLMKNLCMMTCSPARASLSTAQVEFQKLPPEDENTI